MVQPRSGQDSDFAIARFLQFVDGDELSPERADADVRWGAYSRQTAVGELLFGTGAAARHRAAEHAPRVISELLGYALGVLAGWPSAPRPVPVTYDAAGSSLQIRVKAAAAQARGDEGAGAGNRHQISQVSGWSDAVRHRRAASQALVRRALEPVWRYWPLETRERQRRLLDFHAVGPGLSENAVLYELVRAVMTSGQPPVGFDEATATWDLPVVGRVLRDRLDYLFDIWQVPTAPLTDRPNDLVQREYLDAMLRTATSQQRANDPRWQWERPVRWPDFAPLLDDLFRLTVDDGDDAWSIRLFVVLARLKSEHTLPYAGDATANLVGLLRAEARHQRPWRRWQSIAEPAWFNVQQRDRKPYCPDLPAFGGKRLPLSAEQTATIQAHFQRLAGLDGPWALVRQLGGEDGRQLYPDFHGELNRHAWLRTKLTQLFISWSAGLYRDLRDLLDLARPRTPDERANWEQLWAELRDLLSNQQLSLPMSEVDVDELIDEIQARYRRARAGGLAVELPETIQIGATGWPDANRRPNPDRRKALRRVILFEHLNVRPERSPRPTTTSGDDVDERRRTETGRVDTAEPSTTPLDQVIGMSQGDPQVVLWRDGPDGGLTDGGHAAVRLACRTLAVVRRVAGLRRRAQRRVQVRLDARFAVYDPRVIAARWEDQYDEPADLPMVGSFQALLDDLGVKTTLSMLRDAIMTQPGVRTPWIVEMAFGDLRAELARDEQDDSALLIETIPKLLGFLEVLRVELSNFSVPWLTESALVLQDPTSRYSPPTQQEPGT